MYKILVLSVCIAAITFSSCHTSPGNVEPKAADATLREEFSALLDSVELRIEEQRINWDKIELRYQRLTADFEERKAEMDVITRQKIEKVQRTYNTVRENATAAKLAAMENLNSAVEDLALNLDASLKKADARVDKLGDETLEELRKKQTFIEENYENLADSTKVKYDALRKRLNAIK